MVSEILSAIDLKAVLGDFRTVDRVVAIATVKFQAGKTEHGLAVLILDLGRVRLRGKGDDVIAGEGVVGVACPTSIRIKIIEINIIS